VRQATGKHSRSSKPKFSSCATTKVYRQLRRGSYTFYVRAVAADGERSATVERAFKIR
jgi:hypothetical protein